MIILVVQRVDKRIYLIFFFLIIRPPPISTLFPFPTLFRSPARAPLLGRARPRRFRPDPAPLSGTGTSSRPHPRPTQVRPRKPRRHPLGSRLGRLPQGRDRKSTRLNSSHSQISYAVFCLKKK